jgi:hypothetical protein
MCIDAAAADRRPCIRIVELPTKRTNSCASVTTHCSTTTGVPFFKEDGRIIVGPCIDKGGVRFLYFNYTEASRIVTKFEQ